MNRKLLKSIMVLHGDTNQSLAEYLGLSKQSVCNKINDNGAEFKQGEINRIKIRYDLTAEQIAAIFFN